MRLCGLVFGFGWALLACTAPTGPSRERPARGVAKGDFEALAAWVEESTEDPAHETPRIAPVVETSLLEPKVIGGVETRANLLGYSFEFPPGSGSNLLASCEESYFEGGGWKFPFPSRMLEVPSAVCEEACGHEGAGSGPEWPRAAVCERCNDRPGAAGPIGFVIGTLVRLPNLGPAGYRLEAALIDWELESDPNPPRLPFFLVEFDPDGAEAPRALHLAGSLPLVSLTVQPEHAGQPGGRVAPARLSFRARNGDSVVEEKNLPIDVTRHAIVVGDWVDNLANKSETQRAALPSGKVEVSFFYRLHVQCNASEVVQQSR